MKFVLLSVVLTAMSAAMAGYRETKGISYWPTRTLEKASAYQKEMCTLDLKIPAGATNFATYVFLHGGGLYAGKPCYPYYPADDESIARVAVSYRLMPNCGFAQCIEDAAAATAWVLDHIAEYGGDPKKVVLGGHSAGGYLTCMVGMDPRWLGAFGHKPTDLLGLIPISGQVTEHFAVRKYAGDRDPQFLPKINERAPLDHVAGDFAPICIICGDRRIEWKCRVEENELLFASIRNCSKGRALDEFHECRGANHGSVSRPAHAIGQAFIRKLLSEKPDAVPLGRPLVVGMSDICAPPVNGKRTSGVRPAYCQAVYEAGHVPFVISATTNRAEIARVFDHLDVLVLPGGEDVEPVRYHEKVSPACGRPNALRDEWEWLLLDEAVKRRLPVVATCRGLQIVNVYFGGTLYQDIPAEIPGAAVHNADVLQEIGVAPGSRLAGILGSTNAWVNTWHHQSVKNLAPGFRVTARTSDGVVEAIESEKLPIACVQFHPEQMLTIRKDRRFLPFFTRILDWAGEQEGRQR